MFLFGQLCEGTNWAVGFEIFPVCFPESTEITLSSSANHEMETACVKWFSNDFSLGECFLILLLLFNVESMARRYFWFLKKKFTVRIRFSEVFTSIHLWDQKYLTNSHFWKSSWSLCSPAFVLQPLFYLNVHPLKAQNLWNFNEEALLSKAIQGAHSHWNHQMKWMKLKLLD